MTVISRGASISRDRAEPTYSSGETATFDIRLNDGLDEAHVCLSNDGYRVLLQQPLQVGNSSISGVLEQPGVLQCRVNWIEEEERHSALCAAAYDPLEIQPTTTEPDDFEEFWQTQKCDLAQVPLDPRSESIPENASGTGSAFSKLSLANIEDTRIYGYLASPPGCGPFPAILTLQNHGGGAWSVPQEWATSFAEQGFISMAINTHDVDNGLGQAHYDRLNRGPLASYTLRGFMDREEYYFKAVYTRVVRAIDYLTSRPDWDGKTMILTGRSQGGGLSLVGAGLDQRVTGVVCAVPAMCEHGGHRFGRPSGWPRFVPNDERDYGKAWATAESGNGHGPVSEMVWKVSRYYDAVNFARRIKCPAVVNLGLIDTCVPPTTAFSAYNVLQGPKNVVVSPDLGHDADRNPDYRRDERICEMATKAGSEIIGT